MSGTKDLDVEATNEPMTAQVSGDGGKAHNDAEEVNEDENTIVIDPETEELDLNHHKITKIQDFEPLTKLKKLCLRWNLIKKIENLSMLTTLTELELYDNQITEIENLEALTNLEVLDLSYNRIKQIKGLDTLSNLVRLYLVSNKIQQIENLSNLTKLTHLELGDNKIRKIENLENLENLTELHLGKNKVTKLENLEMLKSIKILGIMSNRLTKIEGLEKLINLEELYMSENAIEVIEGLGQCTKLTTLDLALNRIRVIENVSHLTELRELWLNSNFIEDWGCVEKLNVLSKLETVYLEHNPLAKDTAYRRKLKLFLPSLLQIDATLCRMLGIKEIMSLILIPFLFVVSFAAAEESVQDLYERSYNGLPFDRRLQYLLETKSSVTGIKNLIDELQNRLEKRTACVLDGGFSASCNHKDAVEAGEHHRFLASSFAPGRRKRRSLKILARSLQTKN